MVNECEKCKRWFLKEGELQSSHDAPCYLFPGKDRPEQRKNGADAAGRTWLCKPCHKDYEAQVKLKVEGINNDNEKIEIAKGYARELFGGYR